MANRNIERAVRVALLASAVSAGAYSAGAFAQEAGATPDEVEQIIVTGSRIPQPNLEGASPVTQIGSQNVELQGITDSVNLVNSLPQSFSAQASTVANGASGTSTIDLRNLGSSRTLVLVNGRRLPAGDPASLSGIAPDINFIPAPLINRVEVLTGGAGAVYGSDAIAGVVNFIMKDDFEGVEIGGQYSLYNTNNQDGDNTSLMNGILGKRSFAKPPNSVTDGDAYDLSILMGSNFADGKGNATMFVGYRHTDPVMQGDRISSACALQTAYIETDPEILAYYSVTASSAYFYNGAPIGPGSWNMNKGVRCGGSGTNATGTYYRTSIFRSYTVGPDGNPLRPAPLYNYAPLNYYQRPDERWNADVFMHYDVTDQVQAYGQFMFMDDHTVAQIAPSGIFSTYYDLPCDPTAANANPLVNQAWLNELCYDSDNNPITAGTAKVFMQRRNVEGGPRQDDLRHTDYQGVLGIRGKIWDHWNYDLFGQYGTTILNEHVNNYVSNQRAAYALDVIIDPRAPEDSPTSGQPVCAGYVAGYAPDCVPWNIWAPNGVTTEALNYINVQGFSSGSTSQTVVNGSLSADLGDYDVKMPWAASGIGVAFGVEYRQEDLQLDYDTENTTGDLGGGSGVLLPVKGGYNLMDYFAEARVPIVEDAPGAKSLVFNGSYRYSDYSTGVNASTYGMGLDWAPMDDFKLRGSYQHAVRAPNVLELFTPQAVGLFDWSGDPCGGTNPAATIAECQLTDNDNGNTAAWYGTTPQSPAGQWNAMFGGQADLKPETGNTWTVGLVLTPTFLESFNMTIDYWNIKVEDVISSIAPATTVANCIAFADPYFCDNIHRNEGGSLWTTKDGYISALTTNLGYYHTTGTDFNINYNLAMGDWGSLNFNELATWVDSFEIQEIPGYGKYDCKGFYGPSKCTTPTPEWKSKFQTIWSTPWNVDISVAWRYIDSVELETYSKDPDLQGSYDTQKPFDKYLGSRNYIDLGATYTFAEHYTMNAGINNLFDEAPPLSGSLPTSPANGNTYPGIYDALGRYVFVGLTAKF
ncbi:MAG: TonB-dependent receptor [Steroidobacteraceae bacterium]